MRLGELNLMLGFMAAPIVSIIKCGCVELKIYFKYVMWGIKLKGLRTQADLSYSQGYDDDGDYSKDDNIKEDNDKGDMYDKDNLL